MELIAGLALGHFKSWFISVKLRNSLNFAFNLFIKGGLVALRVSVRFFTTLKELVGKREETLEFSDKVVTVNSVLKRLSERYGKGFVEYVFDDKTGEVKGFLQFLINGRSASTLNGLDTKLRNGDVLAIIPPVGGG